MKKKLLIFCILSAFFCTGCSTVKEVFVSEEEMISSVAELHETVENALKKGQTEIHFVTETLGQADLVNLNEEHDGFYGSVRQYEMKTVQWLDRSYITLQCEISDNYYVENAILYGGEIPTERVQAQELKKSCEKILKKIDAEASDYKKEKKIHDYLVRNVAYGYPEGREQKDSTGYLAYGALVEGKAVCNGYAQAMKLLCDLTGVECQMIAGQADGENHAWNLVRLGEKWYHADVTWDDPEPDEKDRMLYSYFNLHDEEMALTHQWNAAEYVAAEGRKYQYYRKNDLYCKNMEEFRETCEEIFAKENPESVQVLVEDYDEKRYNEENLQFIFRYSGAESIHLQTIGKASYTVLYFTLRY